MCPRGEKHILANFPPLCQKLAEPSSISNIYETILIFLFTVVLRRLRLLVRVVISSQCESDPKRD